MYTLKEVNKSNSGFVLEIFSKEIHSKAKKYLPNIEKYNSKYKYYLIPNNGVAASRSEYEYKGSRYTVITIDQIVGLNYYEIY